MKNAKNEVESFQQSAREIQASLKLPLKIITSNEHKDVLITCQELSKDITELAKELMSLFTSFTSNDGLISLLNKRWNEISPQIQKSERKMKDNSTSKAEENQPQSSGSHKELASSTDAVFEDEERSILLFEAVKKIGNPEAIGVNYPMSWGDIIECGFRDARDMNTKGITNLAELQKYIDTKKKEKK